MLATEGTPLLSRPEKKRSQKFLHVVLGLCVVAAVLAVVSLGSFSSTSSSSDIDADSEEIMELEAELEELQLEKLGLAQTNMGLRKELRELQARADPDASGTCPNGFMVDTCLDLNECSSGQHQCAASATCTNFDGYYTCACNTGYEGDGYFCEDSNECIEVEDACHVDATCTNTEGGYSCECNTGYEGGGFECTDIDECDQGNPCGANAVCLNVPGSYACQCDTGYDGDPYILCEDVNECSDTTPQHGCQANAECTNTDGSYYCSCYNGYDATDAGTCTDSDECAAGTHSCSVFSQCVNTDGGYSCICNSGYTGDGDSCTDIDECLDSDSNECSADGTCYNLSGGYQCECNAGYTGDGYDCDDADECSSGQATCDDVASCINTLGSYQCICPTGFTGSGRNCTDVNECTSGSHSCDANASCENHEGTYACSCNDGFYGTDGIICTDLDECEESVDNCDDNAVCTNTEGSFLCECLCETCGYETGYYYAGLVDGDLILGEPEILSTYEECCTLCDSVASCIVWSYRPAENECYLSTTDEHVVYDDAFLSGFINHNCNFVGDGVTCHDVNECEDGTHNCELEGGVCVNTEGGFTCGCPEGIDAESGECIADGTSCSAILEGNPAAGSGLYIIQPDSEISPVTVWCDMDDGTGWTVVQQRVDDSVDFYRGWDSYKTGFGSAGANQWIGLQNLHALTVKRGQSQLRVTLEYKEGTYYEDYAVFTVGDSSSYYQLTVSGASGTAGDSLMSYHNGALFSTYDGDHDSYDGNCASLYLGGWWYNKCHTSNLNGHYYHSGDYSDYATGVAWYDLSGYYYSLPYVRMAVRG